MKVIHAQPRIAPSPIDNKRVDRNPPPLLWPAERGEDVRYAVRLSQDSGFPECSTIAEEGFPWAMFNPHQKLAPGVWYWQYGTSIEGGPYRWSDRYDFEITGSVRCMETPSASDVIAACPKTHPRLWVLPDGDADLKGHSKRFTAHADQFLNVPLKDDAMPPDKGEDEYQVFKFHRWGSKALAGSMASAVQWLIPAYLLSGEACYAREAIRRGLHVANWDADGYTNPVISDFADGSCMRVMAGVYDSCFDLLTESQRAYLRAAMVVRAERFFREETNKIETLVFRSHFWQHLLIQFSEVAFALLHEYPDAAKWVRFVYELWIARFPLMGGADGGWANGNSYFGTNVETLLVLPSRIGELGGVDLFQDTWYKNSASFLLYTWPPHSRSDGFGDGTELKARPTSNHLDFVEDMAGRFDDPYAAWYVQQWREEAEEEGNPLLMWHKFKDEKAKPRPRLPRALPQGRCFADVGIVSLHTDLANTQRDLMVGMRSSPYGSLLHSHECQNGFNIFYGGEPLFRNSGYYTSAGDDHSKQWYRATRGHNLVLIDGKGQPRGAESYGIISRFLDGEHMAYALGDASNAYGDAGLRRFRRHLVLLRPDILVIYDDLEADHDARWQWLVHGDRKITADVRQQRLHTQTRTARGQVNIFGSQRSHIEIDTVFDPPAVNWGGNKTFLGENMAVFPDQWHVTVSPERACNIMRFLAVFQVCDREDEARFQDPVQRDGCVYIDDWIIRGQVDPDRGPALEIQHEDKDIALGVDVPSLAVGGRRHRGSDVTVLVEPSGVQRTTDTLPEAAR